MSTKLEKLNDQKSSDPSKHFDNLVSYVHINLDRTIRDAFIDSGAKICVMNENLFRNVSTLKNKTLRPVKKDSITSVRGHPLDIIGCVDVDFFMGNDHFVHTFKIARDIQQSIILGWDFLLAHEIDILLSEACLSVRGKRVPLLRKENISPTVCNALVAETLIVPANSEMIIPLKLVDGDNSDMGVSSNYEGIFEADSHIHESILVANVATRSNDGIIPVLIMNLSGDEVQL